MMTITTPTIVVKHSSNQGVVAGIVGSVLAVFGIFTWGLIFVPLAAICTLVALVRGITGKSAAGIGCSLLAGALTFWGVVVSPSIWIVVGAGLLAAHSPSHPATVSASTASGATFGTSLQPVQPVAPAPPRAPVISKGSADALEKQANAIANAAMMECRNKRLSGEIKTYAGSVECSNPRVISAYGNIGYRYMDLIFAWMKNRLELAQKTDAGQLTESQLNFQTQQFLIQLRDLEKQRDQGLVPGHRE